ncbi:hypothetical protein DFH09DRAFT_1437186 [Mycena vulgaris]|nr:hypothetical protein DFH09DRAFT_1437186 [Mycena vulgaris]
MPTFVAEPICQYQFDSLYGLEDKCFCIGDQDDTRLAQHHSLIFLLRYPDVPPQHSRQSERICKIDLSSEHTDAFSTRGSSIDAQRKRLRFQWRLPARNPNASTVGIGPTPSSISPSSVSAHNPNGPPSVSTAFTPAVSSILRSTPSANSGSSGKEVGWKVFMQGLGVLKEVSVVFPPLQAGVLEQVGEITDARDDLAEMTQRIAALASLLRRYEGCTIDQDVRDRLEGMATAIHHQKKKIEEKLPTGVRKIVANSPNARYVMQCTRAVSFLINIFEEQIDTALHTEAKVTDLNILAEEVKKVCA